MGGYATKPHPVTSQKQFVNGFGEVTFIQISKYNDWILFCIYGKSGERSSLKRSQFFTTLHNKAKEYENMLGGRAHETAVAAGNKEDEDPMDLLDTVASATGTSQTKKQPQTIQIHPA